MVMLKELKSTLYSDIPHFMSLALAVLFILFIVLVVLLPAEVFLDQHKIWVDVFTAFGTVLVAFIALWPNLSRNFFPAKLKIGINEN